MAKVDRGTYTCGRWTTMFQRPLRFIRTGDWWIKVRVENQGVSDEEAIFTIPVKPAL